jgi:hypothetical protein
MGMPSRSATRTLALIRRKPDGPVRTVVGLLLAWGLGALAGCGGEPGGGGDRTSGSAVGGTDTTEVRPVSGRESVPREVRFNRDIRPILSDKCFACHGPDAHTAEAGLQLHTFEAATAQLDSGGAAVVPGDPASSVLWARVNDARDPMPPRDHHKPLSEAERTLLGRWIEQGAAYQPHWAYVPPRVTPPPTVRDPDWPETEIDCYLLHRLEAEGLVPVADADRATLLRRVTYDLAGLPPTLAELDAFLADTSPDAYEHVVDRLLAGDHFGERLAVFWLDLVRYADSVGYHGDQTHSAAPYRDWVIWAFNANLPFDTFTIHQLAGDLVDAPDDDSLIASCYNRLLQTSHEGGVQFKEYLAIYNADRVRSVSGAWMGATLGCAQCHDHKYDPYTAHDFYAMAAFFADIDDVQHIRDPNGGTYNRLPTPREPEITALSPLDRLRIERFQAELDALDPSADPRERALLEAQVLAVRPRKVMVTRAGEPRTVRLLPRGNWMDESGPIVEPAVPAFLGTLDTDGRADRLDLARWLVTPEADGGVGGMTARVFMNRLWAQFFGGGLCPSLDDFGGQGSPPNHPELLDHLALAFIDSGWDIKAMVKRLVMSRSYRLSSIPTDQLGARDPLNTLFGRQSRQRMPAEMIRDTALAVSGLLVDELGGAVSHPYQPAGYYSHLNFPVREYKHDTTRHQWRRGVYMHWQRQFLHPMLKAFDAPTREECTAERSVSNTPLAALNLLNDPTFVEAARGFAQRILTEAQGDDAQRIAWAMRTATARGPSAEEVAVLRGLLDAARAYYHDNPGEAERLLGVGLAPRDESLDPVEHAAWAEAARAILNLHETITRG